MATGLTEAQLQKIIQELSRMSGKRADALDRETVEQILNELNLPADQLDEAMLRVEREDARKQRQAQYLRRGVVAGVVLVSSMVSGLWWFQRQQNALEDVVAVQDRITLPQDNGGSLAVVNRQQASEVFYRVTLDDAPVGQRLALECHWTNPAGVVVQQNRYETREIATPVWTTYCRLPIGSGTETGTWTVDMTLNDRQLESGQFEIR